MDAFVLLGAPGAGKGTVAERLVKSADLQHVSTGDMLREAVKAGSPIGIQARSYMEKGGLVPDDVILGLVRERVREAGENARHLFDGFPRTEVQAEGLDAVLHSAGGTLRAVFQLNVPEEVLVDRLSGRRICRACGAVYHVRNIPTKVEGVCDRCGGETYQRPDDNEETVRNRLAVYREKTEGLIAYYRSRELLVEVPAAGPIEETEAHILEHIPPAGS